jgi:hypothetical protein
MTSTDNPFFAKAAVNRLWGQFFGFGLVDPVDDFHDSNPPSHPELLNELAKSFADSGFDQRYLIRAICSSKAYRRTSARTDPTQDEPRLYARAVVRAMSGEQFFDSIALATGHRDADDRGAARRQFLTRFAPEGKPGEPQTSILQALTLMNGRFTSAATDLRTSPTLTAVAETPSLTTDQRIESLYLTTLSRKPTADELSRMRRHLAKSDKLDDPARLADVFWVLLNSAEFRLNH